MVFTLGLFLTLVLAVFIIATSSIGIHCIRTNAKKDAVMPSSEKFLIVNLVVAIFVVLISGFMMTNHPHAKTMYNAGGKAYSSVAGLGSST